MSAAERPRLAPLKRFFVLAGAFFNGGAKRQARLWVLLLTNDGSSEIAALPKPA